LTIRAATAAAEGQGFAADRGENKISVQFESMQHCSRRPERRLLLQVHFANTITLSNYLDVSADACCVHL
jgi:hypothetical protein